MTIFVFYSCEEILITRSTMHHYNTNIYAIKHRNDPQATLLFSVDIHDISARAYILACIIPAVRSIGVNTKVSRPF